MKPTTLRIFSGACLTLAGLFSPLAAALAELENANRIMSEALAAAETAHPAKVEAMNTKYLAALKRLEAERQKAGDLRALLMIRDDIKVFEESPDIGKGDSFAQLDFLRDAYLKEVHRLQLTRLEARVAQHEAHVQSLDNLLKKMTRENLINEALEVEKALKEASQPLAKARREHKVWSEVQLFETLAILKGKSMPKDGNSVEPAAPDSPESPARAVSPNLPKKHPVPLPPRPSVFPLRTAKLVAWGEKEYGQVDVPSELREVADVASGWVFAVALTADGKVVSWGGKANEAKKFKGLSPEVLSVPDDLPRAVAVGAGRSHAAALLADGSVSVWGTSDAKKVPEELSDVRVLKCGGTFVAALQGDRQLMVWGSSKIGTKTIENVFDFAVSNEHLLALTLDGKLHLLGAHANGSGSDKVPEMTEKPVGIAASFQASFALGKSGSIVAWGGSKESLLNTPQGPFLSLHGGHAFALGLKPDGTLVHWGDNAKNQIPPSGLRGVVKLSTLNDAVFALIPTPIMGENFEQTWKRWNPRPVLLR